MTFAYKMKYVLWGVLLMAIIFLPALTYLKASVFTNQQVHSAGGEERLAGAFEKVVYKPEIVVQDESANLDATYDADWQREESRLLRSFTWLEDELKIAEKTQELEIYQNYLSKLDRCTNGDWDCLESVRWQMDDFAFAMEQYLK